MKQYQLQKERGNLSLLTGMLTLLLLLCRDSMIASEIVGFYRSQFIDLGLIALLGIWFLGANFRRWKEIFTDPRLLIMTGAAMVCLIPMLIKQDWQLMYCSVLVCILLGIFFTFLAEWRQLVKWYICAMAALGAYSILAAYVLRLGVDRGSYQVPTFINGAGFLYHNFLFAVVPDTYNISRNCGIFREPGVYQFFLLLALYFNNDAANWEKNWQQWALNGILAITMASTFATGGVIEMGLLAVLLFFDKKWYQNRKICVATALLAVCVFALLAYCFATKNGLYKAIYQMFVGKFQGTNQSGSARIDSITVNLRTFLESPLVGKNLRYVLHSLTDNTSSTMILLAGFGIFAGILNLISWLALVWHRERKAFINLCYWGILLMSFNTQNLIADVFLWLFPMMALTEYLLSWWESKQGRGGGFA